MATCEVLAPGPPSPPLVSPQRCGPSRTGDGGAGAQVSAVRRSVGRCRDALATRGMAGLVQWLVVDHFAPQVLVGSFPELGGRPSFQQPFDFGLAVAEIMLKPAGVSGITCKRLLQWAVHINKSAMFAGELQALKVGPV